MILGEAADGFVIDGLGSGVSRAIFEECGGDVLQEEIRTKLAEELDGKLDLGTCLITSGGTSTRIRHLLHVASVDYGATTSASVSANQRVTRCTVAALERAAELGSASSPARVAFPLLAAGHGGLTAEASLGAMVAGLKTSFREYPEAMIDRIVFAVPEAQKFVTARSLLERLLVLRYATRESEERDDREARASFLRWAEEVMKVAAAVATEQHFGGRFIKGDGVVELVLGNGRRVRVADVTEHRLINIGAVDADGEVDERRFRYARMQWHQERAHPFAATRSNDPRALLLHTLEESGQSTLAVLERAVAAVPTKEEAEFPASEECNPY